MKCWTGAALVVAIGVLGGCSGTGEPQRYHYTGAVTLDGQPIPYGEVLFTPDVAAKNSGPQGIAPIRDGKYDTRAVGGKGLAGGPTIARVQGMSGPKGKTLCEYDVKVDLPRADGTHDIAVPKSGAAKPPGKTAPEI
ncbi:MAG: hypothetical protein U0746_20985 [Gemmataceae bacterium]